MRLIVFRYIKCTSYHVTLLLAEKNYYYYMLTWLPSIFSREVTFLFRHIPVLLHYFSYILLHDCLGWWSFHSLARANFEMLFKFFNG